LKKNLAERRSDAHAPKGETTRERKDQQKEKNQKETSGAVGVSKGQEQSDSRGQLLRGKKGGSEV